MAALAFMYARYTTLRSYLEPDAPLQHPVQTLFGEMIKLCLSSYDTERRLRAGDQLSGWKYVGNHADLSLHLWRKDTQTGRKLQTTWALVIRGTQLVQELVTDYHLLRDSTSGSSTFNTSADRIIALARDLLALHQVGHDQLLFFTGHSLGATYAEILLHVLRSTYTLAQGVTFESPGQPSRFRVHRGMPVPLPGLITLNSTPNPINTLNRPSAAAGCFYACGPGAGFPMAWFIRPVYWVALQAVDVLLTAARVVHANVRTHSLRHLEANIHGNTFQASDPVAWPLYTGNAAQTVYRLYCRARRTPAYKVNTVLDNHHITVPVQAQLHPGLTAMPSIPADANGALDLGAMAQRRVYKILTTGQLVVFRDALGPFDVVYAIVGPNSVGKSSVFKAVLGLNHADISVPIGPGANTTPFPVVAYVGTVRIRDTLSRVYLMDLPGLGAAGADQFTAPFILNQPSELIELISPCVGSVFYVEKDSAPGDHSVRLYTDLSHIAQQRNMNIRVIYNTVLTSVADQIAGQAALTRRLTEGIAPAPGQPRIAPFFDPTTLVRCRAITGDSAGGQGNDVAALVQMWNVEITAENISRAGQNIFASQRPAPQAGQAADPVAPAAAGGVMGAAGLGGVGYLTSLQGVGFWGLRLCTLWTTNICAAPLAITLVSGAGIAYGGYQGAKAVNRWWSRTRAPE